MISYLHNGAQGPCHDDEWLLMHLQRILQLVDANLLVYSSQPLRDLVLPLQDLIMAGGVLVPTSAAQATKGLVEVTSTVRDSMGLIRMHRMVSYDEAGALIRARQTHMPHDKYSLPLGQVSVCQGLEFANDFRHAIDTV